MSVHDPFPTGGSTAAAEPVDPRLAGRWRRFWALTIDWALMLLIWFVVAVIVVAATGVDLDEEAGSAVMWGVLLLVVVLYQPLLLRRRGPRNGQTLGKQLLGVRVVTREGLPVTFWRGVRRDVLGTTALNVITAGIYWLVDYPVGLFSDRRQTLHDRIGATFVFRADVAVRAAAEQIGPLPSDPAPFESDQWDPRQRDEVNRAFGR